MTRDTWLEWAGLEPTPDRLLIAEWLDRWYHGIYHHPWTVKGVVEGFRKGGGSRGSFFWSSVRTSLGTFDFDEITRAVFLAHDMGLRFDVGSGPNRLMFSLFVREREGSMMQRHPYLEDALAEWRKRNPDPRTCRDVLRVVKAQPGICLKELIDEVEHHYGTAATARASLSKWAEAGKVPGVRCQQEGRFLRIYPIEEGKG